MKEKETEEIHCIVFILWKMCRSCERKSKCYAIIRYIP